MNTTHYVYTLAYPDGTVFYVGRSSDKFGSRARILTHLSDARRGTVSRKNDVIREIIQKGDEVLFTRVYESLSDEEALTKERELIAFYGRSNLTNKTDGDRSPVGRIIDSEERERIQDRVRRAWETRRRKAAAPSR